jgi:hypothetical protein
MIYKIICFTGINYYKLALEENHDSIFTTITTKWKPGFIEDSYRYLSLSKVKIILDPKFDCIRATVPSLCWQENQKTYARPTAIQRT